jgi:transposase-like protein
MAHANARLTPAGRLTLVERIAAQPRRSIAHIAHEMGISRTTAYRWWGRYQQLGEAGLVDRPSIPVHSPRRTAARLEERILRLRRRERLGPARIAARLGVPALHRASRPGPPLDEPAGVAGPPHRPADPPLRA